MLKLINVDKIYETKVEKIKVLDSINFVFNKGDFVSIQGKSGSGKTTLLNILGLLDTKTRGSIYINGINVDEEDLNTLRNKNIGFVFQFHYLLNEFSALENVMLPALIRKDITNEEVKKKAEELLEMVELKDRMHHKPNELSGGEKQRVAIARALINDPELILADEPTGNLDFETSNVINNLFVKLNKKGQGIIIVTHSRELAELARDKYLLIKGKLQKI